MEMKTAALIAMLCLTAANGWGQSEPYRTKYLPPACVEVEQEYNRDESDSAGQELVCDEACRGQGDEITRRIDETAYAAINSIGALGPKPPWQVDMLMGKYEVLFRGPYGFRAPFTLGDTLFSFAHETLPTPCAVSFYCTSTQPCAADPDGKDCKDISLLPFKFIAKGTYYELNQLDGAIAWSADTIIDSPKFRRECRKYGGSVRRCVNQNKAAVQHLLDEFAAAKEALPPYIASWPEQMSYSWLCKN